MTTNKDVKRVIRTRMKKTGESYTAARSVIVKKGKAARAKASAAAAAESAAAEATKVSAKEYAALSGYSDAVIKARTGCTWKSWVGALDCACGREMTHGVTAKGPAKSTVSVQHVKLAAQDDRETRRAYWKERLTRLTAYLSVGKS